MRRPSQTSEHRFQRAKVQELYAQGFHPVVNIASKEDPACLADFNAINVDITSEDASTGTVMARDVPNFVQGDATNLKGVFEDGRFGLAVLGEVLEHLFPYRAEQMLSEAKRIIRDDGRILLTFPRDPRPGEAQHDPPVMIEYAHGMWSHHVTVWTDEMLKDLFEKVGVREVFRQKTVYVLGGVCLGGLGLILEKVQ